MSNLKFTDSELNLMSYQELRSLSTLLRLPANIKKEYMISMIQAHQKGDGCTKTVIANKVLEERKIKRLNRKGKQSKPFIMVSTTTTQQFPADLSISAKHEFETRFSYVAHYTSKDKTTSGISRIIKEESEVSRRNQNILQQSTRKPNRKLSTMGRTEIMLPRNHSLTTPVRLMPQYERGFAPPNQYESVSGLTSAKNHFQDGSSYNYHFHGEYSNSLMPSSSHEMYRNETYWHPREIYNNSLMPILSSLLTPNPVTINSSSFTSHYTAQNTIKTQSSFQQGVYEKYIKSDGLLEEQTFDSAAVDSAMIMNNHFENTGSNYSNIHRGYFMSKNDVDIEINSNLDDIAYQYSRRNDSVIRHSSGNQPYVTDVYFSRSGEISEGSQQTLIGKDGAQDSSGIYSEDNDVGNLSVVSDDAIGKTIVPMYTNMKVTDIMFNHRHPDGRAPDSNDGASENKRLCLEAGEKLWDVENKSRNGEFRKVNKDILMEVPVTENRIDVFENTRYCNNETSQTEILNIEDIKEDGSQISLPRCRFSLGHNKYPGMVTKKNDVSTSLPPFCSTFCLHGNSNEAYTVCRNSFTGTTETHANPIMTSTYATQCTHHTNSQLAHNMEESGQVSRPWLYAYSESQSSFPAENANYSSWNDYPSEMEDKLLVQDNAHEIQIVKCRRHGCHYLFPVPNPPCNGR